MINSIIERGYNTTNLTSDQEGNHEKLSFIQGLDNVVCQTNIHERCRHVHNTTLDPCNSRMLPWGIGSQKEPCVQVYAASGAILMIILSTAKGCLMKMQIIRTWYKSFHLLTFSFAQSFPLHNSHYWYPIIESVEFESLVIVFGNFVWLYRSSFL